MHTVDARVTPFPKCIGFSDVLSSMTGIVWLLANRVGGKNGMLRAYAMQMEVLRRL